MNAMMLTTGNATYEKKYITVAIITIVMMNANTVTRNSFGANMTAIKLDIPRMMSDARLSMIILSYNLIDMRELLSYFK